MAEGVLLRLLSVNVAAPVKVPILRGSKLMLRLQAVPGVREKLLLQSAGDPEPTTWTKSVPTVRPVVRAFSGWLPMF